MKDIDKLAWFCFKEGCLLGARSEGKTVFYLPGGKRDPGESDEAALIREVKEELSVDLIPETLQPIHVFREQAHGKPEGVMVRLSCYTAEYSGDLKPASEIEEIDFLGYKDRSRCSSALQVVMDWLKDRNMIE